MNVGMLPETWSFVTRFGEAQIVLPLALAPMLPRGQGGQTRALAMRWLAWLGLAVLITTATKVAFIGWGIGSALVDFTGISGHTMFAAAVYPVLLSALAGAGGSGMRNAGIAVGCAIAFLVGVSRVVLGAHSVSEVVAGWLLGGAVAAAVLVRGAPFASRAGALLPVLVALWLSWMPAAAPASNTHSLVTQLALALSGHDRPHTRSDLWGVAR